MPATFLSDEPTAEAPSGGASFLDEPRAAVTPSPAPSIGQIARTAGEAALEVGKGFVKGLIPKADLPTLTETLFPPAIGPIEAYKQARGLQETVKTVKEAQKTPPFSKERFEAGFSVAAQMAMLAGGVRGLRKPTLIEHLGFEEPAAPETPEAVARAPVETPAADQAVRTTQTESEVRHAEEPYTPPSAVPAIERQPAVREAAVEAKEGDTRDALAQRQEEVAPAETAPPRTVAEPQAAAVPGEAAATATVPAEPRLLPGEKQGDLISSTQAEPFALVGEKGTDFEARARQEAAAAQQSEEARLKAEHEQGLLEDFGRYQKEGGPELLEAIKSGGRLPALSSETQAQYTGELQRIREAYQAPRKERIKYADIFSKSAGELDALTQHLKSQGFDVETPGDTLKLIEERLISGKPLYGMEARGTELGEVTGERQFYGMGIRAGEPQLANKIIKTVQSAVQTIQKAFGKPKDALGVPTLNLETGGGKPPPPDSIFSPNSPPEGDPAPIYAMRVTNSFKRWWEKFWPRDLAVTKVKPDSPIITAHQQLIKSSLDYMEKFADQPWWKALRSRSNEELIDLEDRAVKTYQAHVANGVEPKQAYEAAVSGMPDYFQAIVRHRESRGPIEVAAANDLAVDPPVYRAEPYVARLTNEEGKDVVDLHPSLGNLGKQIRTTIGSFDNSRVHATMKDGIAAGTQYEPVARSVWLRELTSTRLEATADLVRTLKGTVLFDTPKEAVAASPKGRITQVRGIGGQNYYARSPEEAVFLEQNISTVAKSPLGRIQQLANTYVRNPSLVNPLPHVTKNMFFKYALARVGNATLKADTAEFTAATPSELLSRFQKVMPFPETGERMPQLTAREVGTWAEKTMTRGMRINNPSSQFIFAKADPAMRYSLWKSYVRKGIGDQEAANHVWLDLIRYDANSGGMNFWKSIPFNFFVPWRTGTYVTLAKALTSHPLRTVAFIGAVEYLREMRYRQTGKWTHLPVDYVDAPLAEAVDSATKIKDLKSAGKAGEMSAMTAATTLVFGPGGGQAPNTIKDVMAALQNDPQQKSRIQNMFWGISQMYNLPREWQAYRKDGQSRHLVNLLTTAALAEHSALKYEPRRLMKWLPEWMPGLQKSQIIQESERLRGKIETKAEKGRLTYEKRHGVSATFERTPEEQQLEELRRGAGFREKKSNLTRLPY